MALLPPTLPPLGWNLVGVLPVTTMTWTTEARAAALDVGDGVELAARVASVGVVDKHRRLCWW
jgi:hypothetical protein